MPQIDWTNTGSIGFVKNYSTAFGVYDNDNTFVSEAPKVLLYVIRSLGYPQMQVQLTPEHIYTSFQASAMKYSSLVNQAKISDNLLNVYGQDLSTDLTKVGIFQNVGSIFQISSMYGQEATIRNSLHLPIYQGKIQLKQGQQQYELKDILVDGSTNYDDKKVQILEVYYYPMTYQNQAFDPMIAPGFNMASIMQEFGGVYSMNARMVVMPIFETLLKMQSLEMSRQIRRSDFGFELRKDKIIFHPVPLNNMQVCIQYILKTDKIENTQREDVIDTILNFPIKSYVSYDTINVPAKNWIQRYTLALSKQILGLIRSKYSTVPYPEGQTSLDGQTLRTEAKSQQQNLVEQITKLLEQSSMSKLLQKKKDMAQNLQAIKSKVPMRIYIG